MNDFGSLVSFEERILESRIEHQVFTNTIFYVRFFF